MGAFYYGKNATSVFAPLWRERCVAAFEAMHFSVCVVSTAHTFLFQEMSCRRDSLREYLMKFNTESLRMVLETYSREGFREEYEVALAVLEEVLREKEKDSQNGQGDGG